MMIDMPVRLHVEKIVLNFINLIFYIELSSNILTFWHYKKSINRALRDSILNTGRPLIQ